MKGQPHTLLGSTLCRPLSDGGGALSAALPVVRGGMRWHTYRHCAEQGKTDRDEGALPGSDGGSARHVLGGEAEACPPAAFRGCHAPVWRSGACADGGAGGEPALRMDKVHEVRLVP